uniref:RNA-binding protein Musashi n=1 Tax=Rhipicephalus appendiculatus TaxID=34631 RepID=A0A131YRY5_RHIAP
MARRDNEEQGKIFVGGLSWETTQESLLNYFSRFGEVVDSVVMCNETGRSRGFGFVTFRDPSCVATVLAGGPHQLDGRTVDPKSCNPRSASRPGGGGGPGARGGPRGGGGGKGSTTKIFVGGLPATVTETDLHAFFSEYGKVTEVLIMYDQEQRRSRGFGFVSFETEDAVNQLTGRRYVEISGKQVECKRAEPKESRMANKGGRPGGGGGWGGQQQQQQWGWGSSNGAGNNMNTGYQGYSGYNSWGNNQSNYGYGGAGDQSYSGYGSYGQQQPSSYGPMRTNYTEGYTATPTATGGYNAPSTNGMAGATVGQTDGSYHPYRR